MDLILWRHAFARRLPEHPTPSLEADLARELTAKGHAQAAATAQWLLPRLDARTRVLCSPALRCQQTLEHLRLIRPEWGGERPQTCETIGPQGDAGAILEAAHWPHSAQPVLVVGHQPALGEVVSRLLGCQAASMPFKKSGVWWLRHRERNGVGETTVWAVVCPESLVT